MSLASSPPGPAAKTPPTYVVPALEKAIDVIELLTGEPGGLTISEIATRLGRSISELFRVVVVLDRRGWLFKDPGNDRYRVTYKLLEIAHRATPAQELAQVAAPLMHDLALRIAQSCHLVVLNDTRGLVILRQENPGPTAFAVRVGTAVDLAASCSGHVLLAFADARTLAMTGATIDPALAATLDRVRASGHQRIASALMQGVTDISCPVFGFDGGVVAALTVPFLTAIDAAPHVSLEDALIDLSRVAARMSTALGWYGRDTAPAAPALSTAAAPRKRRTRAD
ncbi:transcriptional regulator, IclR family protein [Sphingomonas sp. Leaf17]|uniref:IclR family transcriptional regulator n=1 Tax=Sphingomonas sp. Leaf17 TaxID=1735683 RepID=UPI0006FB1DA3|nr:IclR family transcriptional regulator [Sphingomonas sp. Leaf17]KQM63434.1 transcriptional regulator, IclR family protein [Sphingomonas sp. Leaf17]